MKGCKTEGSKCEEQCDQGVMWQELSEPYCKLCLRDLLYVLIQHRAQPNIWRMFITLCSAKNINEHDAWNSFSTKMTSHLLP
jgi:hypothetical protein